MIKQDSLHGRRFTICTKGGHDVGHVLPSGLQGTGRDVRARKGDAERRHARSYRPWGLLPDRLTGGISRMLKKSASGILSTRET